MSWIQVQNYKGNLKLEDEDNKNQNKVLTTVKYHCRSEGENNIGVYIHRIWRQPWVVPPKLSLGIYSFTSTLTELSRETFQGTAVLDGGPGGWRRGAPYNGPGFFLHK